MFRTVSACRLRFCLRESQWGEIVISGGSSVPIVDWYGSIDIHFARTHGVDT